MDKVVGLIPYALTLIALCFTFTQGWKTYIDGQVAKAKEQSAGAEAIKRLEVRFTEMEKLIQQVFNRYMNKGVKDFDEQ